MVTVNVGVLLAVPWCGGETDSQGFRLPRVSREEWLAEKEKLHIIII